MDTPHCVRAQDPAFRRIHLALRYIAGGLFGHRAARRPLRDKLRVGWVTLAFWIFATADIYASTVIPTARTIRATDQLEYSIATSDAIVVAELVDAESARLRASATDDSVRIPATQWRVRVLEWIKGRPRNAQPHLLVGHNRFLPTPIQLRKMRRGQIALVFMTATDATKPVHPKARFVPSPQWNYIVNCTAYDYSLGVHMVARDTLANLRGKIREIMNMQTLPSLSSEADLIVYGVPNFDGQVLCRPFGEVASCIPISVTNVLHGTPRETVVPIYSVIPFYKPSGSGVIAFLRARPSGCYELVQGPAGFIAFDDEAKDVRGVTFAEWSRQIQDHLAHRSVGRPR